MANRLERHLELLCGFIVVVVLAGASATAMGQDQPSNDAQKRANAWRADLRYLVETLPKKHPNPFTVTTKNKFEAAAKELDGRLDGMPDHRVLMEFRRLFAMIGDAHTAIGDTKGRYPPRQYPFSVVWLADGVFVVATTDSERRLLGARLDKIGTTPIGKALDRVAELVAHENESHLRKQASSLLSQGDALASLGLIAAEDKGEFTFSAAGQEIAVTLAPMAKGDRFVATKPKVEEVSFTRRPHPLIYGFTMLPESRDLYVWYHQCQDRKDKSVAEFTKEVLAAIDKDGPDRVIVDLRRNAGGNSALIQPLVNGLAERKQLQGKLFALISRVTFSSGMWAAIDFKNQAKAILVGEPTGGKPNSFGEVRTFELPNSGLTVFHSTRLWRRDPTGDPASVMPDVTVSMSSADFFTPRDVMIDAVRTYKGTGGK